MGRVMFLELRSFAEKTRIKSTLVEVHVADRMIRLLLRGHKTM